MFLTSLKHGKGGVKIEWTDRDGEKPKKLSKARQETKLKLEKIEPARLAPVEIVHSLSCADPGHKDLAEALAAFKTPCLALLELTNKYGETLTVTGIHQSEQKGSKRGLVVNLTKTLKANGRPLNLATPLIVEGEVKPGEEDPQADMWLSLDRVIGEAVAYINGKRAQTEMFDTALQKAEDTVGAGA